VRRSNSTVRRACAVGTTIALVGLSTGLGIMTATSASAVEQTSSTTVSDGGTATPPATVTPAADGPAADAPVADSPAGDAPAIDSPAAPASPAADAPATDAPATGAPSAPASDAPATAAPTTAPESRPHLAAAAGTVTIDGVATIGSTLTAEPSGFTAPTALSFAWTVDGTTVSQAQTYVVKASDAGKVLMVTVTNTQGGVPVESESAQTDPVTQSPVFVDEAGTPITAGTDEDQDDDFSVSATAGAQFSYTFRATGSPKPVLSLDYYYADDDHEGQEPADQLPEGFSFDPATGVLRGSTEEAQYVYFAVTATSGSETVTQTVELDVEAAAPVGLEAYAFDRATYLDFVKSGFPVGWFDDEEQQRSGSFRSWIVKADGSIVTEDTDWESDGSFGSDFSTETPGGTPTIPQGGTLLLSGNLVDEYGNPISDDETGEGADITVRSNVASDVVAPDSLLGDGGYVSVTFPHASVHRLTVSATGFSTAFDVQVTPTTVATVPKASTPIGTVQRGTIPSAHGHGRLAYTGAEETTPIAWALGLLVAGAGLIGARTLRRRRAQR